MDIGLCLFLAAGHFASAIWKFLSAFALNLNFKGGRDAAKARVAELLAKAATQAKYDLDRPRIDERKTCLGRQYVFGELEPKVIRKSCE